MAKRDKRIEDVLAALRAIKRGTAEEVAGGTDYKPYQCYNTLTTLVLRGKVKIVGRRGNGRNIYAPTTWWDKLWRANRG